MTFQWLLDAEGAKTTDDIFGDSFQLEVVQVQTAKALLCLHLGHVILRESTHV